MNILIVGNGGREHALAWRLSKSSTVDNIYVAPGNGGTASGLKKVSNIPISGEDFPSLVAFAASHDVELVIPGPEAPLVEGITEHFRRAGIYVFGPSKQAANLEGSKAFSKDFMAKHNIPTASYATFKKYDDAIKYLNSISHKVVIKASGLAAGKGVLIPNSAKEAQDAIKEIMLDRAFGSAGDEVVIEEFLEGDELSILALTDGYTIVDLPPAQDHKRIGDGDTGLNTGGMGAYAPAPCATPEVLDAIRKNILTPTINGMRHDGFPMVGVLFVGIMLTPSNNSTPIPKVLEYNVRFGDPETQTILPLLTENTDLAQVMLAAAQGRLDSVPISINHSLYSTTVVMSAGGYPSSYKKGDEITFSSPADDKENKALIFHAGTALFHNQLVTAGGRVIAATATGSTLKEAVENAYKGVDTVSFHGKYYRHDIAHRAFKAASLQNNKKSITYASAGVSIENGNALVDKIKAKVRSTSRPGADSEIGGFGGLFDLSKAGYGPSSTELNSQSPEEKVFIVAATDGVGTKLTVANAVGIHKTVGIDLVAMNVNDIIVQGAEPLLFVDYFACSKLDVNLAADFVSGVADGCIASGCALVGGETAEMPGLYNGEDYDAAGTAVGALRAKSALPKLSQMSDGDVLLGLASSGVHSNGFSLVRKIIDSNNLSYNAPAPWLKENENSKHGSNKQVTIGESLLTPTRIYVKSILKVIKQDLVLGMAHITGGGLIENIPRTLPETLAAHIDLTAWERPEVFKWLQKHGNVPTMDIIKTLNNGIGMVLVIKSQNVAKVTEILENSGEKVYKIGNLVSRKDKKQPCIFSGIENWDI